MTTVGGAWPGAGTLEAVRAAMVSGSGKRMFSGPLDASFRLENLRRLSQDALQLELRLCQEAD
jgi:hypothetical protein